MATFAIIFGQNVEQKWFHVVVQGFMIQKQFCQQTQILTIQFVHIAIHFKYGNLFAPVDFGAGWMPPCAFLLMTIQYCFAFTILQTEFTQKQFRKSKRRRFQLITICALSTDAL